MRRRLNQATNAAVKTKGSIFEAGVSPFGPPPRTLTSHRAIAHRVGGEFSTTLADARKNSHWCDTDQIDSPARFRKTLDTKLN